MPDRSTFVSLVTATSMAVCVISAEPVHAQRASEQDYNLPPQPLSTALSAIARVSGHNILASGRVVDGKRAPALVGRFSTEAALARILEGSGLNVRSTPSGLVIEADGLAADQILSSDEAAGETTIVVTGTRIRGAPIASPVISIGESAMRDTGQASLGEVVRSIPQSFGGGQNPGIGFNVPAANGVDVGGGSSINLRGLGSDATLTLLNGHRLSYSSSRQSVDVSSIPLSIVDRLEIVADGASAIYGSDAVAGVANVILKRDYDGFETRALLGGSTDGGNFTQQYGALVGARTDAGGFALGYEFNRNSAIESADRSYARATTPGLTLFPELESHSAVLTGHYEIAPNLNVSADALYNRRREFSVFPLDVGGHLDALRGESLNRSRRFAIAPQLRWQMGEGWQLVLHGSLGDDRTDFLNSDVVDGEVVFETGGCYCNKGQSLELSGTGPLARLPAGDLKAAVGAGYRNNDFRLFAGAGNPQNIDRSQSSRYLYGEFSLPLASPGQRRKGLRRLNVTGAVRYERYAGIGDVATPKIGWIYAPGEWLDLKASWGQSFRAPTLRQQFQPKTVILYTPDALGGDGFPIGSSVAFVQGGNASLKPERATSWSATLALHPPAWTNTRIEVSYFKTRYRDRIVTPIAFQSQALSDGIYQDYVTLAPSAAQVDALIAAAGQVINVSGESYDPANVVAIADSSNVNAGRQRIEGIDALIEHRRTWENGDALTLTANAAYLSSDQRITNTQPITNLAGTVFNPPHLRARASASWSHADLTLTGTLSYIGGVKDVRETPAPKVAAMVPFDLTARYRTPANGLLGGLDIVLSAQNLFNDKPATIAGIFLEAPYDSTNYSPIGRYVSLSIAKKW